MELIGELERTFAALLYPWRYVIAALAAVTAIALLVVARRRRWDLAVRRHPVRSLAILGLALAVGLPTGWYLGSPLFIRTALDEPDPAAAAASPSSAAGAASPGVPGASTQPAATVSPVGTAAPASPLPPFVPRTLASGAFAGADSFHFGRGTATLIETAPGTVTLRFEDFSVRNGPDLYVYLSPRPDGYDRGAVEVGRLKATDGAFNYDLPAGLDPSATRSIVIWCRQFSVLFATAGLTWT